MGNRYRIPFEVQTEGTGENEVAELTFAAASSGKICNFYAVSQHAESANIQFQGRIVKLSVAGAGGVTPSSTTGGALRKLDANVRTTAVTPLVKDVAVAFSVGTVSAVAYEYGFSTFGSHEMNPTDAPGKYIPCMGADVWALTILSTTADRNIRGFIDFED